MSAGNYGSVPQEPQETPTTSTKERLGKLVLVAVPLIVKVLIIYDGAALFTNMDALLIATILVYAHAAFELLSGVMFVFNPGALHNGWNPSAGMNTYLAESGGIAYCTSFGASCSFSRFPILRFCISTLSFVPPGLSTLAVIF
jgi:hypothetical protein